MQLLQHFSILWLVIALPSFGQATWPVGHGPPASSALSPSDEAGRAYINSMQSVYLANTYKQLITAGSTTCTINNIRVRQCWDDMSQAARQEYIRAAKCLAQQPSQADLNVVPGARTRIDDYIWQHVEQSNYIHNSGLLLPWHRQYIWAWEEDLRRTCNYTGALPYWDWSRHAYEQKSSPVFGIDSFGGNGAYVPHNATDDVLAGLPQSFHIRRDAGTGGGCVQDGPFANNTGYSLDIGLVLPANNSVTGSHNTVFPNNTFGQLYQPRCLKRDFLQSESSRWANYTNVGHLMRQKDIQSFHPVLETGGVHFVGHSFVGGDGADFYASPNEPTFFLHHAQVDRLWTIWQAQDFASRGQALDGTTTVANIPPSANATLDTIMEMGFIAGGKVPIRQAMSATEYAMCYVYL